MNVPSTVKYPSTFRNSASAGNDGDFHWEWVVDGILAVSPGSKIRPTDIDATLERNGNFLFIETKDEGVPVTKGQHVLLSRLHAIGVFTIMLVWGKKEPAELEMWYPPKFGKPQERFKCTRSKATEIVSKWFRYADQHPQNLADVLTRIQEAGVIMEVVDNRPRIQPNLPF